MSVQKHFLFDDNGKQVQFIESPNTDGRKLLHKWLVVHYTAGGSALGTARHFQRKSSKTSAHLIIDRDGSVIQCLPFNKVGYHAGRSEWEYIKGSVNRYTIGIELVNYGPLKKNKAGQYLSWTGKVIPEDQVLIAKHKSGGRTKAWQTYTEAQIQSVEDIAGMLVDEYKLLDIIGHEQIDS